MVWTVFGAVAVVAALFLMMGRGKKPSATSKGSRSTKKAASASSSQQKSARSGTAAHRPKGPYAAVAIKPGKNACARVQERTNVRYLESTAPTIPVLGCDSPNCQCGYTHHPDRRTDDDGDRRMGIGLQSQLYGNSGDGERRHRRGRRISDH